MTEGSSTGGTKPGAIRIANCSGFYGDRLSAAKEMVEGGPIDALTGDWLAELTMLILARTQAKRPGSGYARTFVQQMEQVMGPCLDQGIKVVPEKAETPQEKKLLTQVMTHLRDVKMIKDHTLEEIEPMKEAISLLKKHGVVMQKDYLIELENSKTNLIEVSDKALREVKEAILPLQSIEADNIKKKIEDFTVNIREIPIKQEDYRNNPQLLKAMIVKHLEDVVANEEPVSLEHQDDTKYESEIVSAARLQLVEQVLDVVGVVHEGDVDAVRVRDDKVQIHANLVGHAE